MNNKEFIAKLSSETNTSVANTKKMLNSLIEEMGNIFESGENISLNNLGTFETKKRMERIVVNPSTQQRMLVPPKVVLGFKPSTQLKGKFKKKEGGNAND